jgi:hypothetical protein
MSNTLCIIGIGFDRYHDIPSDYPNDVRFSVTRPW